MPLALPLPLVAAVLLVAAALSTPPADPAPSAPAGDVTATDVTMTDVTAPDVTATEIVATETAETATPVTEVAPRPEVAPEATTAEPAGPLADPVTPSLVPGSISGYVSDAAGPVAGALVTVYAAPSGVYMTQAWTAADGGYATEPLGAGYYLVRFAAANHKPEFFDDAPSSAEATLVELEAASPDPIASALLDIAWGVEGVVTSPSGEPVANAEVHLIDGASVSQGSSMTGPDGAYELVAPTAGPWTIMVIPPSDGLHHTTWFPHDLTASTADLVSIPAGGGVTAADVTLYSVPQAAPDAFVGTPDAPIERGAADGLLGNDSGGVAPLAAVLDDSPTHGSIVFYSTGAFRYTPFPGFDGIDTFTYSVVDAVGLESDEATVTLTIAPEPLIPADDHYTTPFETELEVSPAGVLTNDSGAPTTATLDESPQHGTVELDADGGFRYLPDAGFSGADAFSYRIGDGQGTSDIAATVTVEVVPPSDEPDPDVPTLANTGSTPWAVLPVVAGILLLGAGAVAIGRRRAA